MCRPLGYVFRGLGYPFGYLFHRFRYIFGYLFKDFLGSIFVSGILSGSIFSLGPPFGSNFNEARFGRWNTHSRTNVLLPLHSIYMYFSHKPLILAFSSQVSIRVQFLRRVPIRVPISTRVPFGSQGPQSCDFGAEFRPQKFPIGS